MIGEQKGVDEVVALQQHTQSYLGYFACAIRFPLALVGFGIRSRRSPRNDFASLVSLPMDALAESLTDEPEVCSRIFAIGELYANKCVSHMHQRANTIKRF